MSLDELFGQLRGQQPPAPFAPAETVRRRGRQRSRRQALATGAAVLAIAGAGAGVGVLTGPDRTGRPVSPGSTAPSGPASASTAPSASAAPRPSVTAVPDAYLLQPVDLGPGRWSAFEPELFEGPDAWYWSDACAGYRSGDYRSLSRQVDVRVIGYRTGQDAVVEVVEIYAAGYGAASLDDVRAVVALCGQATPPPGTAPSRSSVVATGFAGDESLLVKHEAWYYEGEKLASNPFVSYVAVVRVGDVVATVRTQQGEEYARTVAVRAAARLG